MSSSSSSCVRLHRAGRALVVQLHRAAKRNCVNSEMAKRLLEAFQEFEDDKRADVLVLHGSGGHFCAGYDLAELASSAGHLRLAPVGEGPGPMGPTRLQLSKPAIAAVAGHAVAGGLELALLCDLRLVEASAVLGVFCRRFGVPLVDGGTARLPALIGLSRALDLILTGRPVSAQEALQLGLANRVVADGQSLAEAVRLANQLAAFPQRCLRADRASALHSAGLRDSWLAASLRFELDGGSRVLAEAAGGAAQFVAGRGRGGAFGDDSGCA